MSEPLTAEEIAEVRADPMLIHTYDAFRIAATLDAATPAPADLRTMLPPCRPPHGSLDDLLFGDATVEEQRARLATLDAATPAPAGLDCPSCEMLRKEYNVAVANGLVTKARAIERRMAAQVISGHAALDGRREEGT